MGTSGLTKMRKSLNVWHTKGFVMSNVWLSKECTATGCVKKTSIDHLHAELKMLPVKKHYEMLFKQLLLAIQKPDYPNKCSLNQTTPPRTMKRTLVIRHSNSIKNILPNQDNINTTIYKRKLKEINIISVSNAIRDQEVNKVLNSAPPPVDKIEKSLPKWISFSST